MVYCDIYTLKGISLILSAVEGNHCNYKALVSLLQFACHALLCAKMSFFV